MTSRYSASGSMGPAQALPRICWHSTSLGPGPRGSPSRSRSRTASSAAWHSTTSNRLAGTKSALDGALYRWLARPIRCTRRFTFLGAPTWITRSTSPQSMPRSSDPVHTTARSAPAAIACSTRSRCSRARLPWWMPIGRLSVFCSQRS